jgi:hypothetical protein
MKHLGTNRSTAINPIPSMAVVVASFSLSLMLAACAVMDSKDQHLLGGGVTTCSSRLGAYKLSKTFLRFKVSQDQDTPKAGYVLESIEPVHRADERFTYCLDFLASPLANDDIQVIRAKTSPTNSSALQLVTSSAVDTTGIIIRKIIRTIFIGLSHL